MNEVAKRNTLFTSIHCEEVVYSKQYCLWNRSLFGNGPLSAQNTVIAVNCRWEQDVQGKDINYIRNLLYTWTKLQKETLCLQSFIVKRSFILNSIASETGHFLEMVQLVHRILSLQLTDVENKTFKVKTLIKSATYFTHERSCKKKHFVYKHSLWRGRLFKTVLPLKLVTFWKWYI